MAVAPGPRTAHHKAAKYIWPFEEADDYARLYDYVAGALGVPNHWRALFDVKGFWFGGFKESPREGRAACLFFWRWWLLQCVRLHELVQQYDWFVLTRTDLRWKIPHPDVSKLDPRYIWIPDGGAYGGLPDRHVVCHRRHFEATLKCVECLWREPEAVRDEMIAETPRKKSIEGWPADIWNFEQGFQFVLQRAGLLPLVRYFPYGFFSVRAHDTPTSWGIGAWYESEGCYVKYPCEWDATMKTIAEMKQQREARHAA